jgi:hypothetical protein
MYADLNLRWISRNELSRLRNITLINKKWKLTIMGEVFRN